MDHPTPSAGPEHEIFTEWAKSQGIEINGVAPTKFPGQGVGLSAQRNIHAGEIIVRIPVRAMLTIESVPSAFREKFPDDIPLQGLLAAYLCCTEESREKYALWRAVWPSQQDFEESLPILWPQHLRTRDSKASNSTLSCSFLPPSISGSWNTITKKSIRCEYTLENQDILPQQEKRLEMAYQIVKRVFQDLDKELFTYYWLIVNTRSFYHVPPGVPVPEDHNNAMALCPFGDYFNHVDDGGCKVTCDDYQYIFKTCKSYEKGEEIFSSYGNHTSDILFTDYGFVPTDNKWDALFLDDIILKDLASKDINDLNSARYLGNYQITTTGPCFRTEVAACKGYMDHKDWNNLILGYPPASFDQRKTNAIIARWIREYLNEAEVVISKLRELQGSRDNRGGRRLEVLVTRWRQIEELCKRALRAVD
ncbi:uncharacterized protein PADG_06089 [Paracoccidioides brasiliensis Pb18]|uniref:SET domain-containing protein n=2 Tax=Paracoccidioides brasiliensis TaxID=121759 RepID=C1GFQ3_PARBD|nr:uncharacterized protein PADG_06089 [Paracoccidioides brasiliensis Pb18]EEH50010.2 hypothetical protein PADG_06089 [Paracoccidioides brasiliensis Pb18]ODH13757.1 hypothetical protein ACO22_06933 [Paracoccidioides brasiliensis]ODH46768.1 hypothetical protein GX48_07168 [Paracoccidioides brasiliensis]